MKYIKKPVVIEAIQWTGENDEEIEGFIGDRLYGVGYNPHLEPHKSKLMWIDMPKRIMTAHVDDYIIKGVYGELDVCKPDIFKHTYELCEE